MLIFSRTLGRTNCSLCSTENVKVCNREKVISDIVVSRVNNVPADHERLGKNISKSVRL